MANKKWGQKRHCAACAAAFYDLNRASIACPKCGAAFEAAALLKSDGRPRKKRGPTVAPPPAAAPPPQTVPVSDPAPAMPKPGESRS